MTLRTRLALLIASAIVAVVVVATVVTVRVARGPGSERGIDALAQQLHVVVRLVREGERPGSDSLPADVRLLPRPAPGERLEGLTRFLAMAMARTGPPLPVMVTRPADGPPTASIRIGRAAWVAVPVPEAARPHRFWRVLFGWMTLIILGATAIALAVSARIVGPLTVLEDAVAAVGSDGLLPQVPETGSASMRATARALNRLSARLKGAMESRMRLVAAAGHDLRTPMTRMRLRAEFLPEEEREAWLRDLDELDRIADDAIRLVREEVDPGAEEAVSLDRLIREIATELGDTGLKVATGPLTGGTVRAAPLALKRALRNLIVNAATHGGGAFVGTSAVAGSVIVTIEDEGPGIPEELLARVFEPFFRVDPARRKSVPGAGLGLAIAREIITRFGGTIAIANRQPHGLRQTVRLPAAASD